MLRAWFEYYPRQAGCFFLLLAGLNAFCAYQVFWEWRYLALANLAEGVLLVIGVIATWPKSRPERRNPITLADYDLPDRLLSALSNEDEEELKEEC